MFYPVTDKVLISLILFFCFYTVSFGHSTLISKLLSLKIWIPISRLAFGMSLSQFTYIAYSFSSTRNSYTLNLENVQKAILINFIYTFLLSNFIFLFMEGPLISMFKKYSGLKGRLESIKKQENLIHSKSLNGKDLNDNRVNEKHGLKID